MVKSFVIPLFLVFFYVPAFAVDAPSDAPKDATHPEQVTRNKNEPWYFNFGFGWASAPDYGSKTNSEINALKAAGSNFKRTPVAVDLGFYWPREDKKSALGVSLFGINDKIEVSGYTVEITQAVIAGSGIWYFGENIGDGFFVRGDLGLANYKLESKAPAGTTIVSSTSDTGWAAQIGGGYSIPVSPETRLSLGLYYSSVRVKDVGANNFSIQIQCLL